jgi:hypothetical protein
MSPYRLGFVGLFLAGLMLAPVCSAAAEMRSINVDYEGGLYSLESEVWFDVDRVTIFEVFLDWDIAGDFSSIIVEAKNVGPDEQGGMGYFIHNRACIMLFCMHARRNGSVTSQPYEFIRAVADPETSDFEVSEETWTFRDEDDGTIVRYELAMKPSFWIPPLIGPYLMKRKLRNEGGEAINRIERIAQRRAAEHE